MIFDEFTIFSIFQKIDFIYLIISINNREINENELLLSVNGENLNFTHKYVRNGINQPILVFAYNKPKTTFSTRTIINISHNDTCKSIETESFESKQYFLTITTLFKDDYKIFPIWYEYYKNQGVDHFYMYYNGTLTPEIQNIFNKQNVTLIEWNYKYWLKNCKYSHHSQMGQIYDALYKYGKNNSEYMIFCDLDEYMNIENTTLRQYILDNPTVDTFGFCNHWARTIDNTIPNSLPKSFYIGDKYIYGSRSKNICKTDYHNLIGIHNVDKTNYSINNLNMFHFFDWVNPGRKEIANIIYEIKEKI